MITASEYRQAQAAIVAAAYADLAAFWATLDLSDAVGASRRLQVFMPALVHAYGDVAATVAANFFEEMRDNARVPGRFSALLAVLPPVEQIQASTRAAVGSLFGVPDEAAAYELVSQVGQRLIQLPGRETVFQNAQRDEAKFARVTTGAHSCDFCLMLAGRGAVYATAASAGEIMQFHGACDCQIVPEWDTQFSS